MLSSHTVGFQRPDNSNLANLTPGLCSSSWSWLYANSLPSLYIIIYFVILRCLLSLLIGYKMYNIPSFHTPLHCTWYHICRYIITILIFLYRWLHDISLNGFNVVSLTSCHHVIFMCCLDVRILSKLCVFFIFCRMLLFIVSSDYNDFD